MKSSKVQKFKSFKQLFFICLIFLELFSGCRQEKEVMPDETDVRQKAQNWFESQKLATPLFKSGEHPLTQSLRTPDWNALRIDQHLQAPLLEMPLQYKDKYLKSSFRDPQTGTLKIGVTRILLRQNPDETFTPIIMRLYADSAYLAKADNPFQNNSFKKLDPNFSGEVFFYDWQENLLGANRYKEGKLSAMIESDQKKSTLECTDVIVYYWQEDSSDGAEVPGLATGGGYWASREERYCWLKPTSTGESIIGVPEGNGGGFDPYGGGSANPTLPLYNPNFSEAFNKIVDWSKTDSTDADVKEIDKEIDRLYKESCLFKCMLDQLATVRPDGGADAPLFKMGFKVVPNYPSLGRYDPYTQTMFIDFEAVGGRAFSAVIHEEMIHAYQDVFDRTYSRGIPPSNSSTGAIGVPNVEVDAKLLIDIENFRKEKSTGKYLHRKRHLNNRGFYNDEYEKYLKAITNDGIKTPQNTLELNTSNFNYTQVLQMFKTAYKDTVYDEPIDNNKTPSALLRLVQTCSCN